MSLKGRSICDAANVGAGLFCRILGAVLSDPFFLSVIMFSFLLKVYISINKNANTYVINVSVLIKLLKRLV